MLTADRGTRALLQLGRRNHNFLEQSQTTSEPLLNEIYQVTEQSTLL